MATSPRQPTSLRWGRPLFWNDFHKFEIQMMIVVIFAAGYLHSGDTNTTQMINIFSAACLRLWGSAHIERLGWNMPPSTPPGWWPVSSLETNFNHHVVILNHQSVFDVWCSRLLLLWSWWWWSSSSSSWWWSWYHDQSARWFRLYNRSPSWDCSPLNMCRFIDFLNFYLEFLFSIFHIYLYYISYIFIYISYMV